jgi:hypothetical protein
MSPQAHFVRYPPRGPFADGPAEPDPWLLLDGCYPRLSFHG